MIPNYSPIIPSGAIYHFGASGKLGGFGGFVGHPLLSQVALQLTIMGEHGVYIYISISGWCFKNVRNQPRTTATTRDSAGDVSTYSLHKAHCTDDHFPVNALYQKWPVDQPFDPRGRCQVERHQ